MISFISFFEKEIGFSQKTCLLFLRHFLIRLKCVGVGEEIITASIFLSEIISWAFLCTVISPRF